MTKSKIPTYGVLASPFGENDLDGPLPKRNTHSVSSLPRGESTVTVEQLQAVEQAQNARRGRPRKSAPKKPEPKRGVRVEVPESRVREVEELHYRLGRTKHELYNEAICLLLEKYK